MKNHRRAPSEVVSRQFDPDTGWQIDQARDLIDQGYSVEHVEQPPGWPQSMLLASRS